MDRKTKFRNAYANLPLGLRKEIIVIIDSEPMTWNAASIEVENDTDKGNEILEKLTQLNILK